MKKMLCFGDSNTYGYDASSLLGRQLKETERWPEVFQEISGWKTVNEGMNGREIPSGWFMQRFDKILEEVSPVDLLAVMLGTNDILNSFRPDVSEIGERMEAFAEHVLKRPEMGGEVKKLLLIAPPVTDVGRYGSEEAVFDKAVADLASVYRNLSDTYGFFFIDASGWDIPLSHDGVHFTGDGQKQFAEKLLKEFKKLGL